MTREALAKVVQRAISDAGFRRQLNSDPAGALRGFDLSADELSALRTGNAGRLSTLGVDQRMSKAFVIGGAVAPTRMAQSDLAAGNATVLDDMSGMGSRTVIPADQIQTASADAAGSEAIRAKLPNDPDRVVSADIDGGTGGTSTVRAAGDDWKFADRTASGGMENYPAHNGLAGPSSVESARVGDDWARTGGARLDDASGSPSGASIIHDDPDGFLAANANADASGSVTGANVIHDDPDGFLAASADASLIAARASAISEDPSAFLVPNANADASGSVTRANVIHDDPDGFLAASADASLIAARANAISEDPSAFLVPNANADASGSVTRANVINDDPDGFLAANADTTGGTAAGANVINDDPDGFLAANANADAGGGAAGAGTGFLEEFEMYLTKDGYDANAASSAVTDAHDRGDDTAVTRIADGDDASGGTTASEGGPHLSS